MGFVVNYPPASSVVVDETTNTVSVAAAGPRGASGPQGEQGDAATVTVGSVTTGAAGSSASVVNSGSTAAAVFDFTIPRGDQGIQGIQGIPGEWDTAQTLNDKTAAYTLLTADAGKLITITSSSNLDVTVDGSLDLAVGQRIDLLRMGTGEVTVVASSPATVNGTPGLKLRAQYSPATLLCVAADAYVLLGDLKA